MAPEGPNGDNAGVLSRNLDHIEKQLSEVEGISKLPVDALCRVTPVSGWSAAEQLDHLLKATNSVLAVLLTAREPLPDGINMLGRVILTLGWIPRGKGKSPKSLHGTVIDESAIGAAIAKARLQISELRRHDLPSGDRPIVTHPRFGGLTPEQGLRFTSIHNRHHLKIVADILKHR